MKQSYFYLAFRESGNWCRSGEVRALDKEHAISILKGLYPGMRFEFVKPAPCSPLDAGPL